MIPAFPIRLVIGQPPEGLPEGSIILNAPRPLYGSREWRGEFSHGVFYVAVSPTDEYRERMLKDDLALDAWEIRFVTAEEWRQRVMAYSARMCEKHKVRSEDYDFSDFEQSYRVALSDGREQP